MESIRRHLVKTADGSYTLYQPDMNEHYHSVNGALAESRHVYLQQGLQYYLGLKNVGEAGKVESVSVLEIGFGTGLNFLLTADYCSRHKTHLDYVGIEAFPLQKELMEKTGYADFTDKNMAGDFYARYAQALTEKISLNTHCNLEIVQTIWPDFNRQKQFDLVYFDAFASARQPEMWEDESIAKTASLLKPGGVFVTYAITGKLKRQLKALDFMVQKAPGAPGKREMLRAVKGFKSEVLSGKFGVKPMALFKL